MKPVPWLIAAAVATFVLPPASPSAEILAMLNYESKPEESLRALRHPFAEQPRREGIAIIDVDPDSETYGQILADMPLPPELVAHHIFYNRDASKAYVTALGQPELRVIDVTRNPYRMKVVAVPDCDVGEDVVFSEDNRTWYLTCMGSDAVIVGDAATDEPVKTIAASKPYPHGIAIHDGIDRLLITSTVRASDLGDAGETVTAIKASTGEVLASYRVSDKPSPAGDAPVEILFVPGANPPVAYITNMYGGTLSAAVWDPDAEDFEVREVFDFAEHDAGVPLEMYFTDGGRRLYVTTAKPGKLHIFDVGDDPTELTPVQTLPAGEGAHHVAFTQDGRYAFVQNSLLNLPGMSDGSITVVDLEKEEVRGSVETFKELGLNPNSIVLLPEWNDPAGH